MLQRFGVTLLLVLCAVSAWAEPAADTDTADAQTFLGRILSIEDTGLGPFEGWRVEDTATGEVRYFSVEMGRYADLSSAHAVPPDTFEFRYLAVEYPEILRMDLNDRPGQCAAPAASCIEGTYVSGAIGDAGSYLLIRDAQGNQREYTGGFDIDAGNAARYEGRAVVLSYAPRTEYQLIDLMPAAGLADAAELSISGRIIELTATDPDGTMRITVENDNEIVEAELPPTMAREFAGADPAAQIGHAVSMAYRSTVGLELIAYEFDEPGFRETNIDDVAVRKYEHVDKLADVGRWVESQREGDRVKLTVETADGQILEALWVSAGLDLESADTYQDREMTFTYVFRYENVVTGLARH